MLPRLGPVAVKVFCNWALFRDTVWGICHCIGLPVVFECMPEYLAQVGTFQQGLSECWDFYSPEVHTTRRTLLDVSTFLTASFSSIIFLMSSLMLRLPATFSVCPWWFWARDSDWETSPVTHEIIGTDCFCNLQSIMKTVAAPSILMYP